MFLTIILFLFLFTLFALDASKNINTTMNSPKGELVTSADPQIAIVGNGDFTGYPGSGNETHPYLLENYVIDATVGHGIRIQDTDAHFLIRNCTIENGSVSYGIYFHNATHGRVENTTINGKGYGMYLYDSKNNTIFNNTIMLSTNYGIRMEFADNNTVISNKVMDNGYGIYVTNSYNGTISHNTVNLNSYYGIYMWDSHQSNLINNTVDNNNNNWDAFRLSASHFNKLINNTAKFCDEGFDLDNSNNNEVINNTALNITGTGISLYHSNNTLVYDNTVISGRMGIYMWSTTNNWVIGNTIRDIWYNGISLYDHCTANHVIDNVVSDCNDGIFLWKFSNFNFVTGNTVYDCIRGIGESMCWGNVIHNNNVRDLINQIPGFDFIFVILGVGFVISLIFLSKNKLKIMN